MKTIEKILKRIIAWCLVKWMFYVSFPRLIKTTKKFGEASERLIKVLKEFEEAIHDKMQNTRD